MGDYFSTYRYLIYCLLLLSITTQPLWGQPESSDYLYEPIEEKTFEDKQWEELHKSLDYSGKAPKAVKEKNIPSLPDFSFPDISLFVKILGFALIIVLIGVVMYHIVNQTNVSFKDDISMTTSSGNTPLSLEELELQLDTQDINPYILKAEEQKNYTLAVRLHFLALLKKLNENNEIQWRKNHTNNTYLNQMRGKNNFSNFHTLTKKYEGVWYGDKYPSRHEYENIRDDFNDFKLTNQSPTA